MPGNIKKGNLRLAKTYKALEDAMIILLEWRNFNQITVNDLCEKAQISRTTYYNHFLDKYDLLKHLLENLMPEGNNMEEPYTKVESILNYFLYNDKIIKNLLENANTETRMLLHEFFISLFMETTCKKEEREAVGRYQQTDTIAMEQSLKQKGLSVFCVGGILNFLLWQGNNKSEDSEMLNNYFHKMLKYLMEWDMELN